MWTIIILDDNYLLIIMGSYYMLDEVIWHLLGCQMRWMLHVKLVYLCTSHSGNVIEGMVCQYVGAWLDLKLCCLM